ncbi:Hydantoinase B multi-domain protein [Metschnikowia bicuspidata var. bicuspidata NRRL YB-4993]|uniref:Hydantoinase B multi-domain protein n=1 Tax=Metschnikowia bicuspidata var. bicuspidata NRRL YB-4993 TaxID=869754 RepID=A0A1A0HGW2_9ASCO|nr:Hydantoinase B multi-domain protein [Metschnikowia bicuspidata var. bicuspidata NRRL YB-4993]OBA23088.1 Hydantoinase B multi-domain protein [Metschnikowia bicuspidata var. bicuspidata NRRL YB-4993]
MGYRIAIDRGGTFTDCVGNPGSGRQEDDVVLKLLSVDPANYPDAPLEGIRRLLEKLSGTQIPRGQPLDTSNIEYLRMGTTVATNALLERKGEKCALITTKGFKDVLAIGNQSRPHIFDLSISKPDVLYDCVVEVDERVTLEDFVEDPARQVSAANGRDLVTGLSLETVRVLQTPNEADVRRSLQLVYDAGIRSVGVCLMHAYTYPDHERIVGDIARQIGFTHVSLSSSLSPMIKFVARANSAIVDAYLTPEIRKYLRSFEAGLAHGYRSDSNRDGVRCHFMQSDGGLVDAHAFSGLRAILSGPAGGVVGFSATCYNPHNEVPLIGFDMGGTSTDVSRYGEGKFHHVFETVTAGVTIQSPQLDINTVAAGGGSILSYKNGLFHVGPESAASEPGPACYRKGGPLTVTDANLYLGRLLPEYFPRIFGPNEDQSLDFDASASKFEELTRQINAESPEMTPMTPREVAYGFIKVANETMARPIRQLAEAKGHVTAAHRLVSFGGAGGQHAVAIAESLGISTVLIHRHSSVLSAYGMALADVVEDVQEPFSVVLSDDSQDSLAQRLDQLKKQAAATLRAQEFDDKAIVYEEYLNLRFAGTESGIMVPKGTAWDFKDTFMAMHRREFGFVFDKEILVDDVRVRAIGKSVRSQDEYVDDQIHRLKAKNKILPASAAQASFSKKVYFSGAELDTPVYRLEDLVLGGNVSGPAIIADGTQTNVVPPGASALVLKSHVVVTIAEKDAQSDAAAGDTASLAVDPVLLSIFGHRFMDIAEQMGASLQKTSVSVNVKERLDFSCALFDKAGNLVANAPHVPVHLGLMSTCITFQAKHWEGKLEPGDVIVSNHPMAGGTHLPDITVISPAFENGEIIFYVASRAHHSDIGGLLPGSMPPGSKILEHEGAAIFSELLVKGGQFQEARMIELLLHKPAEAAGCSGTRRLSDNLSDLKAQIAANQKGVQLIDKLVSEFGLPTISKYMGAIQDNAAETVGHMLKSVIRKSGNGLQCVDYMDDGSPICLKVSEEADGQVLFDFSGTGMQVYANSNAPVAITYLAIIYCLRSLVAETIPLNQGCLRPIRVKIPKSSLLNPDEGCAVVAGNVCTSQIITEVILTAFRALANSQSCMNNFTFGVGGNDENGNYVQGFGYYETIAGGHGAGPTWSGVSGVHTHMTNTRITDAEVFEKRYPVLLREFSIRENSGGSGANPGGCGVVRDVEFRVPVTASILSERRVIAPHGLNGGGDGARGQNIWVRQIKDEQGNVVDHREVNVGGKATVTAQVGDRFIIRTPGGGGFGAETDKIISERKLHGNYGFVGTGSIALRNEAQLSN